MLGILLKRLVMFVVCVCTFAQIVCLQWWRIANNVSNVMQVLQKYCISCHLPLLTYVNYLGEVSDPRIVRADTVI